MKSKGEKKVDFTLPYLRMIWKLKLKLITKKKKPLFPATNHDGSENAHQCYLSLRLWKLIVLVEIVYV